MEKKPKLNLKTIDFSKARLPLDENEKPPSPSISPQLDLSTNGEDKKTAAQQAIEKFAADFQATEKSKKTAIEQLSEGLAKAYDNHIIKAYKQAEEDRRALIQASIDRWNEPLLQTKMREYENLLKNPAYTMAFEVPANIRDYAAQIANSFDNKNYEEAKKVLEAFNPQMNSAYSVAQSALEQMQKTIDSPSIKSYLSQLPNLEMYESGLAKAAASIANNADMIKAAQSLNEIGKSIVNDSFQQRISKHATANLHVPPIKPIEIPKNHLLEHTKRIVDQNDQLIETSKLQNDILNDMAEYMRLQNSYTDQSVKQLERQNEQIEDQIKQKEYEIESNREATKYTLWIALAGIVIGIVVSAISVRATYDVYHSEDIAGNKDHIELLKAIQESSNTVNLAKELQYQKEVNAIQQQQMIRLNQEVEQLKMKVSQ